MGKLRICFYALLGLSLAPAIRAQPVVTSVANAASLQQSFAPGSQALIYGKNLVASGGATTVSVGGKAAYVFQGAALLASQVTVELPVGLTPGQQQLTVTAGGQTSAPVSLTIAAYAPALYTANSTGSGAGVFVDSNFKPVNASNQANPGQALTTYATGLGDTNPSLATGVAPSGAAPTLAAVNVSVGGESQVALFAGEVPSAALGSYQVNFTLPKDATGCNPNVTLTVGGLTSPPVTLPIATPKPVLCAVENAATGLVRDAVHGTAANSFIAVYAAGAVAANANNLFPATTNQGISASYNGTLLPLYSITSLSPSQTLVNTALPANAGTSGSGTLTVTGANGTSATYSIALAPADLGVFRLPDPHNPSGIQGVVLQANSYWFAMPSSLATSYGLPACAGLSAASPCGQPAAPGDPIVIYLTGAGLATPNGNPNGQPLALGAVAPADGSVIYQTVTTPTVTIGGISAPVDFSGIAPGTAAEYQINTSIPAGVQPGSAVRIVITMGGSTDKVTIAVNAS